MHSGVECEARKGTYSREMVWYDGLKFNKQKQHLWPCPTAVCAGCAYVEAVRAVGGSCSCGSCGYLMEKCELVPQSFKACASCDVWR